MFPWCSPDVPRPSRSHAPRFSLEWGRGGGRGRTSRMCTVVPPSVRSWSKLHGRWRHSPLDCPPFFAVCSLSLFLSSLFLPWSGRIAVPLCLGEKKKKPTSLVWEASAWMLRLLCTTYYLVLLLTLLTPAFRRGVYLSTCLCWTLCAFHGRSPSSLCLPRFHSDHGITKWLWMRCPFFVFCFCFCFGWCLILIALTCFQSWIIARSSFSFFFFLFLEHFDTTFDYIYCPSYSELVKAF